MCVCECVRGMCVFAYVRVWEVYVSSVGGRVTCVCEGRRSVFSRGSLP